jgi:alpha/beta hydrolase fold
MDQLPALGTTIYETIAPTYKIYGTILQKQVAKIKSTPRKTFSFGPDPRQNLDVYYPSSPDRPLAKSPILFFSYGGGLVNGSKISPLAENELVYANLGHFFAEKYGYIVVVSDYRLVPQARFPSGGEDIALAIDWIRSNLKELGGSEGTRDLFMMGNSAGGVHQSTYLFSPVFAESRRHVLSQDARSSLRLRAVVMLGVPFHFQAVEVSREDVLKTYYGDRRAEDCPLGLWKSLAQTDGISDSLPDIKFLLLTAPLDPKDEILLLNKDFVDAWNADGSSTTSNLQTGIIDGHNHISPVLSLGTDDPREEAWGIQVADFCESARVN